MIYGTYVGPVMALQGKRAATYPHQTAAHLVWAQFSSASIAPVAPEPWTVHLAKHFNFDDDAVVAPEVYEKFKYPDLNADTSGWLPIDTAPAHRNSVVWLGHRQSLYDEDHLIQLAMWYPGNVFGEGEGWFALQTVRMFTNSCSSPFLIMPISNSHTHWRPFDFPQIPKPVDKTGELK